MSFCDVRKKTSATITANRNYVHEEAAVETAPPPVSLVALFTTSSLYMYPLPPIVTFARHT